MGNAIIDRRIRGDQKYRMLTVHGRYLFMTLLVRANLIGVVDACPSELATEFAGDADDAEAAYNELYHAGMVKNDGVTIWIPNFLKYHPPYNPSMVRSWGKLLRDIDGSAHEAVLSLVMAALDRLPPSYKAALDDSNFRPSKDSHPVPHPVPHPATHSVPHRAKKRPTKFVPPTLEQCIGYKAEAKLEFVDPVKFFQYFTSTGWIDSKNKKVASWKGKMQTWNGMKSENPHGSNKQREFTQDSAVGDNF